VVAALRVGPLTPEEARRATGWPDEADRADRVCAALVVEGVARVDPDGRLRLA
jgi:hypothetical protein